jgi:hypothetical protein
MSCLRNLQIAMTPRINTEEREIDGIFSDKLMNLELETRIDVLRSFPLLHASHLVLAKRCLMLNSQALGPLQGKVAL